MLAKQTSLDIQKAINSLFYFSGSLDRKPGFVESLCDKITIRFLNGAYQPLFDARIVGLLFADINKIYHDLYGIADLSSDEGFALLYAYNLFSQTITASDPIDITRKLWGQLYSSKMRGEKHILQVTIDKWQAMINGKVLSSYYSCYKLPREAFLLAHCLRDYDRNLVYSYQSMIYRLASLICKADGTIKQEEAIYLSSIMCDLESLPHYVTASTSDEKQIIEVARYVSTLHRVYATSLTRHFGFSPRKALEVLSELESLGIIGPELKVSSAHEVMVHSRIIDEYLRKRLHENSQTSLKINMGSSEEKPFKFTSSSQSNKVVHHDTIDPAAELNKLIGLQSVKKDVQSLSNFISIQRAREAGGLKPIPLSYHCVFTGNPGTGKTTVARLLASIYKSLGVIKSGHLIETDRSGLIAEYVGQTAIKTNKIIDSALDGVLFIDEAYSLISSEGSDYGNEAITTLLKRMEDDRERLVVILAGYEDEMKVFINSNPGLQSRFNRYISFEDYSPDELFQIFIHNVTINDYIISEDAKKKAKDLLFNAYSVKDKYFGNGRFVRNFFEKVIQMQADRLSSVGRVSMDDLMLITQNDIVSPDITNQL